MANLDITPFYRVEGCPYVRGYNSIEFNDRALGTVAAVHYIVNVLNSRVFIKIRFYCIIIILLRYVQ